MRDIKYNAGYQIQCGISNTMRDIKYNAGYQIQCGISNTMWDIKYNAGYQINEKLICKLTKDQALISISTIHEFVAQNPKYGTKSVLKSSKISRFMCTIPLYYYCRISLK